MKLEGWKGGKVRESSLLCYFNLTAVSSVELGSSGEQPLIADLQELYVALLEEVNLCVSLPKRTAVREMSDLSCD